jgi:hypothetical protein
VHKLRILLRMLRNRLLSSNPMLRSSHTSVLERIVFVLNFFPPYNIACWLWIRMCTRMAPQVTFAGQASWWLMHRAFLFGGLRHLSPEDRTAFANAIVVPALAQASPPIESDPETRASVAQLMARGFVSLGPLVSSVDANAAVSYFCSEEGYASQTPLQSDGVARKCDPQKLLEDGQDRYFCFSSQTSLACPQVANLLSDGRLRKIAATYLGFTPVMYSVNTIVTNAGDDAHYVMRMHRDQDAFACVTFFVCWTAVAARNGATIYVPRSHVSSEVDVSKPTYLEGSAGEVFCVDTFGLHSGNREVTGPRFATWIRFGSAPNLGTVQDPDLVPTYQFA